jgi:CRISPR-associated protein Cas2
VKGGRLYTVSYDIAHDGRRVKVANVLKSYGERVQYSVFECWLKPKELEDLLKRLARAFDAHQDSIRIYRVRGSVKVMGLGEASADEWLFLV